jgi:hypothetical protein
MESVVAPLPLLLFLPRLLVIGCILGALLLSLPLLARFFFFFFFFFSGRSCSICSASSGLPSTACCVNACAASDDNCSPSTSSATS